MGDLFDGYGSTLAPRKTASGIPAYDEMFGVPASPGDAAPSREAYRELYQTLAQMTQQLSAQEEELGQMTEEASLPLSGRLSASVSRLATSHCLDCCLKRKG